MDDVEADAHRICGHCGAIVESGPFCAVCGAHLVQANPTRAIGRDHAFAAGPHEAVHQPALFSTLLPHLPRQRLPFYRWGMIAGVALVVGLLVITNAGLAVMVGALIVPGLYVAYLYESDVHAGEPLPVIAATLVAGAVLGAVLAWLARLYVNHIALTQLVAAATRTPPLGLALVLGVSMPIVGEVLKLLGPLTLRRWPQFRDEVMDGAAFGIASGIGFAAGATLASYWPMIRGGYVPGGSAGLSDWAATIVGLTVLRPIVSGTTSGLLGAAVWSATLRRDGVGLPLIVGLGGAVVYALGELLLLARGTFVVLAFHGLLLAVLLTALRRVLHHALLDDARELGGEGDLVICGACERSTEPRRFCTHCGLALRARPARLD